MRVFLQNYSFQYEFELNNFTKLFDMIIATILSQTMIFREMQQRIVFFLFFINILYIPDLNC